MRPTKVALTGILAEALVLAFAGGNSGLAEKGKAVFERRCSGCHAADIDKEGPRLRGIYGRKAAGVPGFIYSDALKKLNLRWDEAKLDLWLANPDAVAPGTDMAFSVNSSDERKAVIEYLKTLSTP
jgi:cytochrome c